MTRLEYMRLPKMRRQEIKESIEARRQLGFLINDENLLASVSNGMEEGEDPEFAEPVEKGLEMNRLQTA